MQEDDANKTTEVAPEFQLWIETEHLTVARQDPTSSCLLDKNKTLWAPQHGEMLQGLASRFQFLSFTWAGRPLALSVHLSTTTFDHQCCRARRCTSVTTREKQAPKRQAKTEWLEAQREREWILDGWYRGSVERGLLCEDMAQVQACRRLQKLQKLLKLYDNRGARIWRKQEDWERKQVAELKAQKRREAEKAGQESFTDTNDSDLTLLDGHGIMESEVDDHGMQKKPPKPFLAENKSDHETDFHLTVEDHSDRDKAQRGPAAPDQMISSDDETIATDASTPDPKSPPKIPRGFYLHGEVGTGKSVILQAFFHNAVVAKKIRFHMHEFLADIHQRLLRLLNPRNPKVIAVAREYARECSLLYIDEFQLTDVADTLLVYQVLAEVVRLGTVLVMTSNRSPQGLMEAGHFHILPAIDLIKKCCIVHEIKSTTDYRQHMHEETAVADFGTTKILNTYFMTDGKEHHRQEDVHYMLHQLIGPAAKGVDRQLPLASSQRHVMMTVYEKRNIIVGECSFANLCVDSKIGVADYQALAEQLDVLILYDIPSLSDASMAQADISRRFITLIDQFYEWRRPVMCTAPTPPTELFTPAFRYNATSPSSTGVDDIRFAFPRAASRLMEMTSPSWWKSVYDYFDWYEESVEPATGGANKLSDEPLSPFIPHWRIPWMKQDKL